MKNKKIFKKWWFWVVVAVVIVGAIGSLGQNNDNKTNEPSNNTQKPTDDTDTATLPKLNADDYKGKEGLVVYKELQSKGYAVDAEFEKQALTDINGKASTVFEQIDVNKPDDRKSVDAFVVGSLTQDDDNIKLIIVLQPTN